MKKSFRLRSLISFSSLFNLITSQHASLNYSFTSFQDFQKVVGYIGGDKYSDALQFQRNALLSCRSHHPADDAFEVALGDLDEVATLVADTFLGNHTTMLAGDAGGFDEVEHLVVGNDDGRIEARGALKGLGFVGVIFQPFGGRCGVLEKLASLGAGHTGEYNIGEQRLMKGSPLPVDDFRDVVHRHVDLYFVVL